MYVLDSGVSSHLLNSTRGRDVAFNVLNPVREGTMGDHGMLLDKAGRECGRRVDGPRRRGSRRSR